jgi:3-oxoacyl-[acyl-carrier protein] reductase
MSRVVVVSGGGTGIGRAVAASCAKDGDTVVIVGRRADVLAVTAEQIGAHPIVADVGEVGDAERVAGEVRERFGRVDVLVNNAGGNAALAFPDPGPEVGPVARASAAWAANLRSNVLTAVHLTEALRDLLADDARVILLSSIAAFRGSGSGSYGGSKAALHPYAIDLAAALGPRGITVNVVAPGYTTETEFFADTMTDQRHEMLVGQALNKRAGHTDDVAATIRWLTSPGAGHITAQIIQVNGGALPGR